MTRAFRAVVSAALATALMTAFHSGAASAQTPEPEPGESKVEATEQTTDDLQAETAGNEVRGMSVAVVVEAVVFQSGLLGDVSPKFLDSLEVFSGHVTGE